MELPLQDFLHLCQAFCSWISMTTWAKKPEAECVTFSTPKMSICHLAQEGNNPHPGASVLTVSSGALEPWCFLTPRMNSAMGIPKIKLIHLMGNRLVALVDSL